MKEEEKKEETEDEEMKEQKSIPFKILLLGESGTGKSTFIKAAYRYLMKKDDDKFAKINKKRTDSFVTCNFGEYKHRIGPPINLSFIDSRGYYDGYSISDLEKTFKKRLIKDVNEHIKHLNNGFSEEAETIKENFYNLCLLFIKNRRMNLGILTESEFELISTIPKYMPLIIVITHADGLNANKRIKIKNTFIDLRKKLNLEFFKELGKKYDPRIQIGYYDIRNPCYFMITTGKKNRTKSLVGDLKIDILDPELSDFTTLLDNIFDNVPLIKRKSHDLFIKIQLEKNDKEYNDLLKEIKYSKDVGETDEKMDDLEIDENQGLIIQSDHIQFKHNESNPFCIFFFVVVMLSIIILIYPFDI